MEGMTAVGPERIAQPILRRGFDYWQSKQRGDLLPGRSAIDPTEIPSLLPHVELSEVIDRGADFRFRLVGTHLVDTDAVNPTGHLFSDFFEMPAYAAYMFRLYRHVVATGRPVWSGSRIPLPLRGLDIKTERLYLPLATDGRTVDMVLNFQVCDELDDAGATLEAAFDPTHSDGFVHEIRVAQVA
ncbi:MAG: PAS domain-containing protein [Deinococcus-Thermus bacterium]|jgi:hypothetical protein|nr:PAS domain-containing protein [Deinococcota bacterium]